MSNKLRLNAPRGQQVRYTDQEGFESDRIHARKYLNAEEIYTIDYIKVGSWNSTIYLKEWPGKGFNSVMFEEVEPLLEPVMTVKEIYEQDYSKIF